MGKKGDKKASEADSRSSTPQSSTPSAEDETQPLLRRGARGSSGRSKSTSGAKTEGSGRKTELQKRSSSSSASSSRNAPQCEQYPSVPDQATGAVGGSPSPSKKTPTCLKSTLTPKGKSQNRDSNPRCVCKNKDRHQPECPEWKKPSVETEDLFLKVTMVKPGARNPKQSSSEASPAQSNTEDSARSPISSDATARVHLSAAESRVLQDDFFGVTNEVKPLNKSPLKKMMGNIFRSKSRSPSRSKEECRGRQGVEQKKKTGVTQKRSETQLGPSSSGPSSKTSSSKSKLSCNEASRNSREYDPQEGTSMGPTRFGDYTIRPSDNEKLSVSWRRTFAGIGQPISNDVNPIIGYVEREELYYEEGFQCPVPRPRSKSCHTAVFIRTEDSETEDGPSTSSYDLESVKTELKKVEFTDLDKKLMDCPEKTEEELLNQKREESGSLHPPVGRHKSSSPRPKKKLVCNCKDRYFHPPGCSIRVILDERKKRRKYKNLKQESKDKDT